MTQEYEQYTAEDHKVWELLYNRQIEVLPGRASEAYMEGMKAIGFKPEKVPNFKEVNKKLMQITGWRLYVVPGLIGNREFFELLENQQFPSSTWLRKMEQLDYLEEPDMFHDVFGHVPLLTNIHFCNFLKGLSRIALKHIENEWVIELISRVYWYTVEFGLIDKDNGLRIYGAGILSSSGESVYSLEDPRPDRRPFNVQEILDTPYIKDRYQERYWVINGYEQLYESIGEIEACIERSLENV